MFVTHSYVTEQPISGEAWCVSYAVLNFLPRFILRFAITGFTRTLTTGWANSGLPLSRESELGVIHLNLWVVGEE